MGILPFTAVHRVYYYLLLYYISYYYTCTSVYLHFKCKSLNPTSVLMDEQPSTGGEGRGTRRRRRLRLSDHYYDAVTTVRCYCLHSNRSTFHEKLLQPKPCYPRIYLFRVRIGKPRWQLFKYCYYYSYAHITKYITYHRIPTRTST